MASDNPALVSPFTVQLIATGGTIEKTYDPAQGQLTLAVPVLEGLLDALWQPDLTVTLERLMSKDSLDMDEADRDRIVAGVAAAIDRDAGAAILVTHGTDTLGETAAALAARLPAIDRPVVLTGAMVPCRVAASDARQNVAQALMACRVLAPGVYVVFHSRLIRGDRAVKDYAQLTMVEGPAPSG